MSISRSTRLCRSSACDPEFKEKGSCEECLRLATVDSPISIKHANYDLDSKVSYMIALRPEASLYHAHMRSAMTLLAFGGGGGS